MDKRPDYEKMLRQRISMTYAEMHDWLSDPNSRVVDCRVLEVEEHFESILQFLCADEVVREVSGRSLDILRLQYFNSQRMNPALWGLFDKEVEERGQSTSTD